MAPASIPPPCLTGQLPGTVFVLFTVKFPIHEVHTAVGMRRLELAAFLLFFTANVFSQSPNLTELEIAADTSSGIARVQALNALSRAVLVHSPDLGEKYAVEALNLAQALNDKNGMAAAMDNRGHAFQARMEHRQAMQAFLEALRIRDKQQDEHGRAISKTNIGRVFYQMENYTQAEEYLVKALEIWEKAGTRSGSARAFESLGDLYLTRGIFGKAQDNYQQAITLLLEEGDMAGAAAISTLLGKISLELGNSESALSFYRNALELYRELNCTSGIADSHREISLALISRGRLHDAWLHCRKAAEIRKKLNDTFGQAVCQEIFGRIRLEKGQPELAKKHFQQSADMLEGLPLRERTPVVYLNISNGLARTGDYAAAYQNQVRYAEHRNALFSREKTKALLELTTRYEAEFAAKEQQQRIELLEIENANAERMKYFLLVVIGLIAVLLATVYASYRRKKKDNQLLRIKNEEIRLQKQEIDDINSELKHKNISLDLLNRKLVDEMAERENIEKSSFARDRFLATMSHEMRTPLNIITGLTHILLDSDPRAEQARHLRMLQYSANNLVVFINDVLDFSKIEAGKLNLEDREFNPAVTLQEINRQFEEKAAKKNLLYQSFSDKKIPDTLLGDNARLHQILTYLLTNVLHHTEVGRIKSEVVLEELKGRVALLKISIEGTDGGHGRKMLDEVFQPLSEADDEPVISDGEQLSLAITRRLIELQNGKLDVVTQAELSTTFVVHLPYKLPLEDKKPAAIPAANFDHLAGSRILVVEDNKINQLVVAKMLRRLGIEVITANHGLEALEIYEREDFDLILMDIQMPVMDGYRTTAEIRTHAVPGKRSIPIIALTASAFLTEKEKAVLFGMNEHVGKPFSPGELLEKISACMEIYKAD